MRRSRYLAAAMAITGLLAGSAATATATAAAARQARGRQAHRHRQGDRSEAHRGRSQGPQRRAGNPAVLRRTQAGHRKHASPALARLGPSGWRRAGAADRHLGSHSARPPSTCTVAHSCQAREETVTLTASPDRSARRSGARLTRSEKRSSEMARYHATVESRRSATETFGYLATFSNAAEWDPGARSPGSSWIPARRWQPLPARRAVPGAAHVPDL